MRVWAKGRPDCVVESYRSGLRQWGFGAGVVLGCWLGLVAVASPAQAEGHQAGAERAAMVQQWAPYEITFTAAREYADAYTDVDVYVTFTGPGGITLRRPAFWDGGKIWRVRFAAPVMGRWSWRSSSSEPGDAGLEGKTGALFVGPYRGGNPLVAHGLLTMSPGKRNVMHADGAPFLLVGDTAWSLPWRGTPEAVRIYAQDRHRKGFDATLLMSLQPDRKAVGPRDRVSPGGFDVAFEDLPDGHLLRMNAEYFKRMDRLMTLLIEYGIVPVYQPVFQGFGWKGLEPLGYKGLDVAEYARYCRYLVARYGAQPAMWLVSADNNGLQPAVEAGGEEIYKWDAYHQPVGIHYSPRDGDASAPAPFKGEEPHHNRSHQDAEWLNFQWAQTGHEGVHNVSKVSLMHDNLPTKAVANGEPTYEGISDPKRAAGWWQGNEAWSNLTAGGTMGVVYGVAALWQWKLFPNEPGWGKWAQDGESWRTALNKEGSTYVGLVQKAFAGYDFLDMTKHAELAGGRPCVAVPGRFYVVYLEAGGEVALTGLKEGLAYRWFDPKTGEWTEGGRTSGVEMKVKAPSEGPWVLFVGARGGAGSGR
jgi:hypothetical protein